VNEIRIGAVSRRFPDLAWAIDFLNSDLDPTHRSGRYVTDGREPNQSHQFPDSGRWPDSVGFKSKQKSATEFLEIPHGFHTNSP
jgi:hypothetical protein